MTDTPGTRAGRGSGGGLLALPFYPIALSLIAPLDLFAGNVDRLLLRDVLPTLLGFALLAAAIQGVLTLILRDRHRAAFASAVLIVMLFFPHYLLKWGVEQGGAPSRSALLLVIWVAIFAGLLYFSLRSRFASANVSLIGNGMWSLSLLVAVADVSIYVTTHPESPVKSLGEPPAAPLASLRPEPADTRRDIYYIVLDRYANAAQLQEVYGFDNGRFIADLEAEGFFFPRAANANYQRTAHSLASSLNLNYLDRLTSVVGPDSDNWRPLYGLLEDTEVHRFLDRQGYRLLHFGSWWNPTRLSRIADENHNWWAPPEFLRVYLRRSLLGFMGRIFDAYAFDVRQQQCDRIRHKFDMLHRTAKSPGPKFVFAHILLPHPPFVFGRDGSCLSRKASMDRSRRDNYIDQVEYANHLLLELVRALRREARVAPIIVLQADEGPWPAAYAGNEIDGLGTDVKVVDWEKASDPELREKMGILHALHLPGEEVPGQASEAAYHGMTPVNTFRIIFNRYFGTALPLLPDRNYVFRDNERLYSFLDVTDRLSETAERRHQIGRQVGHPDPQLQPHPR